MDFEKIKRACEDLAQKVGSPKWVASKEMTPARVVVYTLTFQWCDGDGGGFIELTTGSDLLMEVWIRENEESSDGLRKSGGNYRTLDLSENHAPSFRSAYSRRFFGGDLYATCEADQKQFDAWVEKTLAE
jgi:hypothetical protein